MLTTLDKARQINVDTKRYGTFAEIGAGQEVVRWFFRAGGAAGTVAKSISAYDMEVSDAIYGDCDRYVSRERLDAMLIHEQALNQERLADQRGSDHSFFTFADTVSARNYLGTNECHAWMGMRFQARPGAEDSVIIVHARMLDDTNPAQQEALGIVGVNLIHAAHTWSDNVYKLVESLVENLGRDRIEIDMIDVSGAAFEDIDNRVLSLYLVQLGLTGAAMFSASGKMLQPSAVLRKRPLLVQRGRFRPITHVNVDMMRAARDQFEPHCAPSENGLLPIMEISMHNLTDTDTVCLEDFVSRAEVIASTGSVVMVSDFQEYHRLAAYLTRYTDRQIGLCMGLAALQGLFDESYYRDLDGGLLESVGRLFKKQIKLLIYPYKSTNTGQVQCLRNVGFDDARQHLIDFLTARRSLISLENICYDYLDIHSPAVLDMIERGDNNWSALVPKSVEMIIRSKRLFGYQSSSRSATV